MKTSSLLRAALCALALGSVAAAVTAHDCDLRLRQVEDPVKAARVLAALYPDVELDVLSPEQTLILANMALAQIQPVPVPIILPDPSCPATHVTPPTDWYSGDTHVHVQPCGDHGGGTPAIVVDDMDDLELDFVSGLVWGSGIHNPAQYYADYESLITGDPHIVSTPEHVLQFGMEISGFRAARLGHYVGMNITAAEADIFSLGEGCDPIYDAAHPDPIDWLLYYLAGLPDDPGPFYKSDGSGGPPVECLKQFHGNPDAVVGSAHQRWPVELYESGGSGWDWEDGMLPTYVGAGLKCNQAVGQDMAFPRPLNAVAPLFHIYPVLASVDVALGWIDFLEAANLDGTDDLDGKLVRWSGLYYKLLSAGLRVSLTGGSDSPCTFKSWCLPRTYAKLLPGDSFSYDAWTRAIEAGRVSVASVGHQFMELEVEYDGVTYGPGDQIEIDSGSAAGDMITVRATYHIVPDGSMQVADTIEVVVDGQPLVQTLSFGPLTTAGPQQSFLLTTTHNVSQSTWLAARVGWDTTEPGPAYNEGGAAHTGAVYLIRDRQPIVDCEINEYWMLYADYVRSDIDWLKDQALMGDLAWQVFLENRVGCDSDLHPGCDDDIQAIHDYIIEGRKVFESLRDYAHGTPGTVGRYGHSTYEPGTSPKGINMDEDPMATTDPILFTAFNGPEESSGSLSLATLIVGNTQLTTPDTTFGPDLFVDIVTPMSMGNVYWLSPMTVSSGGHAEHEVTFTPPLGMDLYAQVIFFNSNGCTLPSCLTATDALSFHVP